jgi:hypothetical protein
MVVSATRRRRLGASPNVERYDPDAWIDEFAFLSRPGQVEIQSELCFDYQTKLASYLNWQAWLREMRPPTLVLWGKYDVSLHNNGRERLSARRPLRLDMP